MAFSTYAIHGQPFNLDENCRTIQCVAKFGTILGSLEGKGVGRNGSWEWGEWGVRMRMERGSGIAIMVQKVFYASLAVLLGILME